MERKVDRLKGVRPHDVQTKLTKDIDALAKQLEGLKKEYNLLSTSNKNLKDECRNIDRVIVKVQERKDKLTSVIQELKLENEMARGDLEKVKKSREKTLVQHDVMKLEIKELKLRVHEKADEVFGLENRKYQLEMSMEEREREI